MQLSILVVSYNTRELTLACIESVLRSARSNDFEIIVVDNYSHDGSADAIATRFPRVHLIRVDSNLGFGGAVNLASQRALGTLFLLLNPDTIVAEGAIDEVVRFAAEHPSAGIWGAGRYASTVPSIPNPAGEDRPCGA